MRFQPNPTAKHTQCLPAWRWLVVRSPSATAPLQQSTSSPASSAPPPPPLPPRSPRPRTRSAQRPCPSRPPSGSTAATPSGSSSSAPSSSSSPPRPRARCGIRAAPPARPPACPPAHLATAAIPLPARPLLCRSLLTDPPLPPPPSPSACRLLHPLVDARPLQPVRRRLHHAAVRPHLLRPGPPPCVLAAPLLPGPPAPCLRRWRQQQQQQRCVGTSRPPGPPPARPPARPPAPTMHHRSHPTPPCISRSTTASWASAASSRSWSSAAPSSTCGPWAAASACTRSPSTACSSRPSASSSRCLWRGSRLLLLPLLLPPRLALLSSVPAAHPLAHLALPPPLPARRPPSVTCWCPSPRIRTPWTRPSPTPCTTQVSGYCLDGTACQALVGRGRKHRAPCGRLQRCRRRLPGTPAGPRPTSPTSRAPLPLPPPPPACRHLRPHPAGHHHHRLRHHPPVLRAGRRPLRRLRHHALHLPPRRHPPQEAAHGHRRCVPPQPLHLPLPSPPPRGLLLPLRWPQPRRSQHCMPSLLPPFNPPQATW